jgi:hypothetical protein
MIEKTHAELTLTNHTSGVPAIRKPIKVKEEKKRSVMNMFMMACCIPMVIGGALIFFAFPADQSFGARLLALAPIAGCLGMHLVMHKFMGKACHEKSPGKEEQ